MLCIILICCIRTSYVDKTEAIISFLAEIVETKQRKSVSNDNVYSLLLRTDDVRTIDLGKLPPDTIVKVTISLDK